MASKNAKEGALATGIAASLAVGAVCLPAGIAMAVGTAILGHIFGVGRFSDVEPPKSVSTGSSLMEGMPKDFEHLVRGVQQGVHDAAVSEAYRIARELAFRHEGATFRISDYGDAVHWAVRSRTGKLIEQGQVEIPLQN